ncbi:ADP-dependent glucokinase-like [Amphiura filiformis]|uniref:ADP-dependent glucokinase-like n=1 Tax=Amphiura filiformis TaxID=82378 RepID=UPI003B21E375
MLNKFTVGLALIALAYYFGQRSSNSNLAEKSNVDASTLLIGWEEQIRQPARKMKRVAIGLNVCADLIVKATDLLKVMHVEPGKPLEHNVFTSLESLQQTFYYFFQRGAAVERFFSNDKLYQKIIEYTDTLKEKTYYIGGNAALMAQKMTDSDIKILFIGPVGPKVNAMFNKNIAVAKQCLRERDEVHLIMEYAKGDKWGDAVAPVATRLITSNDYANSRLDFLEELAANAKDFKPDLIALSGLQGLGDLTPEVKEKRVAEVLHQLGMLPQGVPVHLELASMADDATVRQLATQVFPVVHSIGLNEQELTYISKTNNGPHPDLEAVNGYAEIGAIADILYWMLTSLREGQRSRTPNLSRVHFHSLTFHIIATRVGTWENSASAAGAGARVGGLQACNFTTVIDPSKVELRIPRAFSRSVNFAPLRREALILDPTQPISVWRRGDVEFNFSPVLVCKKPLVTVGLGDAISATGLLYSQYLAKEMPW